MICIFYFFIQYIYQYLLIFYLNGLMGMTMNRENTKSRAIDKTPQINGALISC